MVDGINGNRFEKLISDLKEIIKKWKAFSAHSLSVAIIKEHWEIGQRIVEEEQRGENRAPYGEKLLQNLSKHLTESIGKGYSERSLADFRHFYLQNPDWEILHPRVQNLKWSHFKILLLGILS